MADAAHQVRTPLASLRAQVALEEPDPERLHARIQRIHQNATHASQLINQLLMDATITHRLGKGARARVGVAEAVNETRRRIGPLEARRLRASTSRPRCGASPATAWRREMLRNLVDALRCAPDGPVDIQATPVAAPSRARVLTIAGPTDTPVVAPLIQGFQSQRPDVNVVYREMGAANCEAMIAS